MSWIALTLLDVVGIIAIVDPRCGQFDKLDTSFGPFLNDFEIIMHEFIFDLIAIYDCFVHGDKYLIEVV